MSAASVTDCDMLCVPCHVVGLHTALRWLEMSICCKC